VQSACREPRAEQSRAEQSTRKGQKKTGNGRAPERSSRAAEHHSDPDHQQQTGTRHTAHSTGTRDMSHKHATIASKHTGHHGTAEEEIPVTGGGGAAHAKLRPLSQFIPANGEAAKRMTPHAPALRHTHPRTIALTRPLCCALCLPSAKPKKKDNGKPKPWVPLKGGNAPGDDLKAVRIMDKNDPNYDPADDTAPPVTTARIAPQFVRVPDSD
jgi:hypothetical protein